MPEIPRVLLLGDSIRMYYQPAVTEMLEGKAQVVGPEENCQFSLFTLASVRRWIGELGRPDIVHWNNGLHDCGHNPNRSPVQIPIDMYRDNLRFTLAQLREQTGNIIWATTTPAHPERVFDATTWSWRNDEIERYNDAATALMQAENVPINDLHRLVWEDPDEYLKDDQIHLSEAGVQACARAATEAISAFL